MSLRALLVLLLLAWAPAGLGQEAWSAKLAGHPNRAEIESTIQRIAQGGPFPYRQDGTVFQNRERLLPQRPPGYYREYTVRTPGLEHRGAQRIVAGAAGELWFTADHYKSFTRLK